MIAPIVRDIAALRAQSEPWVRAGASIGVVPTMGALHDGHLSLVAAAKARCEHVIVTIFVNPKQFNTPEDLANYPRTEGEDARKLERFGVDAIYVPDGDVMYPEGFSTTVSVTGLTDVMDGIYRPGHFEGVATVVAKLFTQSRATDAFFGEKDFQQLQVVRRMACDLDIPITVHGCPTIREMDGLAMSSRNLLLSDRARIKAPILFEELEKIADGLAAGAPFADLHSSAIARLEKAGFTKTDYLELRANDDLALLEAPTRPARLFAASWLAGVRIIDNIAVES
ncbi:pantoate--beta-alanine ligase [Roseovarius sp. LXJ103]|uniref:pantoate--beta-alanine ligase n=1 Tax=Roseovarius carneus TaxID=2853164 RepID=UPI000D618274|nr:pantoate--beta-alanine ligase [Roseovarius carneus]MBZ8117470.1 pantoate--beta-alanine ligase [Roseovarius carneus]PWE36730.1 pantoate--beta-alanine ligase [Pelagicola sp. LXJ1103]